MSSIRGIVQALLCLLATSEVSLYYSVDFEFVDRPRRRAQRLRRKIRMARKRRRGWA